MRRLPTRLPGPVLLEPDVKRDERGFFLETFRANVLSDLGIAETWVQDNHSRSLKGTLRGLHYQPGMAKLIRCARGSVVDVVVDLRTYSPHFGEWEMVELDDERHRQLYCPDGFAHGFCVTSELADVVYRCSSYYDPAIEDGVAYDDPQLAIPWPALELRVSPRDASAPRLSEVVAELPFGEPR
ncbi:MAG TPA: dTDP-4-dehydrorhamnose 3,5-epimerase [Solirubrobacteraceae bacterium]|nr:dTDP-4-dehydrorhamnose 3,5-epimerase [Solirubrobacteraceae bacterium]